jgi:plastocyanin
MGRVEGEMIRGFQWWAIAVAVAVTAGRAGAQNDRIVKGTVTLPPDSGAVTDVVVSIEGTVGTRTPSKASIDQKNMTFIPHVLPVVAGSTVEFQNNDDVMHNVFSNSPAQRFDVGMFGRGETRSVTVDKPGVVELRCNVHPTMHAFIVVLENNYFATPDARGNYEISGLPAGRYKLRAWHESLPAVETWANLDDATLRAVDIKFKP